MRCLEDYSRYRRWPISQMQPVPLKFRGEHILHVRRADEPTDVFWENLETHAGEKVARRCFTWCLSLILVLASAAVVLMATKAKLDFQAEMPSISLCTTDIPATYLGSEVYSRASNATPLWPVRRPENENETSCNNMSDGTRGYFLEYENTVRPPDTGATEHAECLNECTNAHSTKRCKTLPCYVPSWLKERPSDCKDFMHSNIVSCYCMGRFHNFTERLGFINVRSPYPGPLTLALSTELFTSLHCP